MKTSKVLVTLLLTGLVLSTGCSSTSKGVSTEGNSVKVDFAPLLTVDQPKPVIEAGPKVPFNPVLDAEGVETLKVKVPYWKTEVGLGQAKLLGDSVLVGQPIGRVGSTGRATGSHLHYEVLRDGKSVDPCNYLPFFEDNSCE